MYQGVTLFFVELVHHILQDAHLDAGGALAIPIPLGFGFLRHHQRERGGENRHGRRPHRHPRPPAGTDPPPTLALGHPRRPPGRALIGDVREGGGLPATMTTRLRDGVTLEAFVPGLASRIEPGHWLVFTGEGDPVRNYVIRQVMPRRERWAIPTTALWGPKVHEDRRGIGPSAHRHSSTSGTGPTLGGDPHCRATSSRPATT